MLVEHRIHDVDEGLVAGEQSMAAGEQIAFEPALAKVLAEHLHDTTLSCQMNVVRFDRLHPDAIGCFKDIVEAIG